MFRYVVHALASVLALSIVVLSTFYILPQVLNTAPELVLRVESEVRSSINLEIVRKSGGASIKVHNTGSGVVLLTAPESLRIKEAYNTTVPVQAAVAEQKSVEPGTGFRLEGPLAFEHVTLVHTSEDPLFVEYTIIELQTNEVVDDTILLVSGTERLW